DKDRILRYWKTRRPEDYLNRIGSRTAGRQELEHEDRPLEFLLNALRLSGGVPASSFPARTGLPLGRINHELGQLRERGLLVADEQRLAVTDQGQRFLNDVLEAFVP
ncbi:MAG: radical SAM family heme chaperone HemW, partial [Pseudomonadota bacterium]